MWKTITTLDDYVPAMDIRNYPFDYDGRIERMFNGRMGYLPDGYAFYRNGRHA